ncbi:unnamed protein product [Rotaria magnacalcarata]|uniref:Uncharacterized protein n=1 Tax=Rotaria magnacalcarata TaxID=392030 RepID=A0A816L8I9_9BILA|nr:unnamed protein product [Rotaria magnacalcarata]CAF1940427.1 unnamed protein product [Rotaria magnacalcarata]
MNSTEFDWNTKLKQSFDRFYPSVASSVSYIHIREILFTIGLITIFLLLLILLIQFLIKVREAYKTSTPRRRFRKSYESPAKYSSYQTLLNTDKNRCKCVQSSCLPKLQCTKPNSQVFNRSVYYEQIDERQINNTRYEVFTSSNRPPIHIHFVK